jgi:dolichol-phosphate mannosyltransferase
MPYTAGAIRSDAAVVELPEPWRTQAVTVVLPTYNEAANLPVIVGELFSLPLAELRVVVVDDNSPDGTGLIAEGLAQRYGTHRLSVLHRTAKEGLGRAYVAGMSHALKQGAEIVVQMDSDLSHSAEYVPQMLGTILSTRAAVVIGSRYVSGGSLSEEWAWRRRLLSRCANWYVQTLLRMQISDVTAGFKMWHRAALEAIDLNAVYSSGYSFQVEMNYRTLKQNMKIVEIPICFAERKSGASKMTMKVQLESAWLPFRVRRLIARQRLTPTEIVAA